MPPLGKILLWVGILGLIGLAVSLVIGAAIVIVPVVVLCLGGWYIYKRARRPRYGSSGW
jgi:hypothetical protein